MCIHNIPMHNMHALIFNWIVERRTLHMHMWSIMANEKMEVCSLLTQAAELLIATPVSAPVSASMPAVG